MRPKTKTPEKPNEKRAHGQSHRMQPIHPPTVKKSYILCAVSSEFGITLTDMQSRYSRPQISDARQVAMYLMQSFGHPIVTIVEQFKRCKWTVQYDIRTAKDKMDTEPDFFVRVASISKRLMQLTCRPPEPLLHRHD